MKVQGMTPKRRAATRFRCPACGGKLRPVLGATIRHFLGLRSRVCSLHRQRVEQ